MKLIALLLLALVFALIFASNPAPPPPDNGGHDGHHHHHGNHRRPKNETRGRSSLKKGGRITDSDLDNIKAALSAQNARVKAKFAGKSPTHVPKAPKFDPPKENEPDSLANLNQDVSAYMAELDMMMTADQINRRYGADSGRKKRASVLDPALLWPTDDVAPIFYTLDAGLDDFKKQIINESLAFWEENVCLDFELIENPGAGVGYLQFYADTGCWSYIGNAMPGGAQPLSIGDGCEYLSIATHEIGHALGFFHEQSRYDRDQYVTVNWANIIPGMENNLQAETAATTTNHGTPYEYGSVMHYSAEDMAVDMTVPVLVAANPLYQQTMGQKARPSFYDVLEMNRHYNCLARCNDSCNDAQCQNGGYPDPKDCSRCKCPGGFGGRLCTEVPPAINGDCGGSLEATADWQTLFADIGDTNQLDDKPTTCFWHINSPADTVIETTVQLLGYSCNSGCFWSSVEIKAINDFQPTGYRHCCAEDSNKTYTSEGNLVPVIAFGAYRITFQVLYRHVPNPNPPNVTEATVNPDCPTPATTTEATEAPGECADLLDICADLAPICADQQGTELEQISRLLEKLTHTDGDDDDDGGCRKKKSSCTESGDDNSHECHEHRKRCECPTCKKPCKDCISLKRRTKDFIVAACPKTCNACDKEFHLGSVAKIYNKVFGDH